MADKKIELPMPAPRYIKAEKREGPQYTFFLPMEEDVTFRIQQEYCEWARKDREVDATFKKWLKPSAVDVRVEWRACRVATMEGDIKVLCRDVDGRTRTKNLT